MTSYFVRFTRPVVVPDTDEGTEVVYRATVTDVTDRVARSRSPPHAATTRCWAPPGRGTRWLKAPWPITPRCAWAAGGQFVVATTEAELIEAVADCDRRGEPVLVVGGGSNLLVADEGFRGTVVLIAAGIDADVSACAGASVRVAAGENWGRSSPRPSPGGAASRRSPAFPAASAPRRSRTSARTARVLGHRVGAHLDRQRRAQRVRARMASHLRIPHLAVQAEPGRYLVLGRLPVRSPHQRPRRLRGLARTLGVEVGLRAPAAEVREAVLALRRGKGMVLDAADHDTWSAGSFFANPVLTAEQSAGLPDKGP